MDTEPLAIGAVRRIRAKHAAAMQAYNTACRANAEAEKDLQQKLLALADPALHRDLRVALGPIFLFGENSIILNSQYYRGKKRLMRLLAQTSTAWEGIIAIKVVPGCPTRRIRVRLTVV